MAAHPGHPGHVGLPDMRDLFALLGVPRGADEFTIKRMYRQQVLMWHPDKQMIGADKELAAKKIRELNSAYEILGNPVKRQQYMDQFGIVERVAHAKSQGMKIESLNIPNVTPRMAIPKEFMLSPFGHPDKFMRDVNNKLFVQSREDFAAPFEDFFRSAKWTVWWLQTQNNMCHMRAQSTAGVGERGGMSITFPMLPGKTTERAELNLSNVQEPQTYFTVIHSPTYSGAFRFEAAYYQGLHLAFEPPTGLCVKNIKEENTIIDFMLVDFTYMQKYKTLEEVLIPVVFQRGNYTMFVSMPSLISDPNVRQFFHVTLNKAMWTKEDWDGYFEGHFEQWEYDGRMFRVRLRSKQEMLARALAQAQGSIVPTAAAVAGAGTEELNGLPVESMEAVLMVLGHEMPASAGASGQIDLLAAQRKLLNALPAVARRAQLAQLLSMSPLVAAWTSSPSASKEIIAHCNGAMDGLGRAATQRLLDGGQPVADMFSVTDLASLCKQPGLDLKAVESLLSASKAMADVMQPAAMSSAKFEDIVPLLQAANGQPAAAALGKTCATAVQDRLVSGMAQGARTDVRLQALEALASGGYGEVVWLQESLLGLLNNGLMTLVGGYLHAAAAVVAALAERGAEGDSIVRAASLVSAQRGSFAATLPAATLRKMIVASAKNATIFDSGLLDAAAAGAAASPGFGEWSIDDVTKVLLAASRPKRTAPAGENGAAAAALESADVDALFRRAVDVLRPRLSSATAAQLIKVVLATGKRSAARPLLEAAAEEAARRAAEFPVQNLILLTQGMLPLGSGHESLLRLLDFWRLGLPSEKDKRQGEQGSLTASADQLAKVAQLLAPAIPGTHLLYEALSSRLCAQVKELTEAGKASLEAAFPGGEGPDFRSKARLLKTVARGEYIVSRSPSRKAKKKAGSRSASRGATKDKEKDRSRSKDKDSKKKAADRSTSRGRRRGGSKEKGKERRSRSKGNKGKDRRSKSRSRRKRSRSGDRKKRERRRSRSRSASRGRRRR
eukprot:TRINITY_DN14854_c0_g1_i1.p1 TRINITY_DN14854_c0_g1~~TRINITY_DN14854_c0_g1_i1.p1  ORF type:complete len:1010 (-),score=301.45 TRINITY_DN14854_c0_g1_i1:38-3067(-)